VDETTRLAQKMAALTAMGFERAVSPPVMTESVPVNGGSHRISAVHPSMGTLVSITAIHPSLDRAQEAMGRAFEEMDRVVGLLNRYDPDSAVTCLTLEGHIDGPPPELSRVVSLGKDYHRLSHGAFDITVQPLVDLFGRGASIPPGGVAGANGAPALRAPSATRPPTEREILEALHLVDDRAVRVRSRSISLEKDGMGVTLDGIAKGYVVDVVADRLRAHGIGDYLINAGGDIRTGGSREDGEPWRVAIQDPLKDGTYPDVVALPEGAVATSGSYEIYFDSARTRHHIVSGETGRSPQPCQSVTVVAPTAVAADALATAAFVMGPQRGLTFIGSLPDCECLIIDQANRQLRTPGWRSADRTPQEEARLYGSRSHARSDRNA
jgi:thiamine biosynthesis lipoprotein